MFGLYSLPALHAPPDLTIRIYQCKIFCCPVLDHMWYILGYHTMVHLFNFAKFQVLVCVCVCVCFSSYALTNLRNVVTAMWYLSQALGTLLNAGVAQIGQINLLIQFLLYMALLLAVTVVFIFVNRHFKYANTSWKQTKICSSQTS